MPVSNHLADTLLVTLCNNADVTELLALLGAPSPTAYVPVYTVDQNVVDSPELADAKVFSTIALAVADAEAEGYASMSIDLVYAPSGTPHVWAGAASGFAAGSTLRVEIVGASGAWLDISGAFPAADGVVFPVLSFVGVFNVSQSANVVLGANRQLILDGVSVSGGGFTIQIDNADVVISSGLYINMHLFAAPGAYLGVIGTGGAALNHGPAATPMFGNVDNLDISNCAWRLVDGSTAGFVTCEPTGTKAITIANCSAFVRHNVAGAITLFDSGTGTIRFTGLDYAYDNTGGGALALYDAGATLTAPATVTTTPADSQQAVAAPASAALVTVPRDVRTRHVYGEVTLQAAPAVAASWLIEVETGIGTGVYSTVLNPQTPATGGVGIVITAAFSFTVAGGRRYRFTKSNGAGTTETIARYSYTD